MSEGLGDVTTDISSEATDAPSGGIEIWRLCSHYTVVQAALLLAGHDAALQVEYWRPEERPPGYEAAKHAVTQALLRDPDMGHAIPLDPNEIFLGLTDSINVEESMVWASSLKKWLSDSGIKTGFFSGKNNGVPGDDRPDYLNPDHPRYSPKLAAAVRAWQACGDAASTNGRSPKQALAAWLKENAAQLELVDKQGKPNGTGIEEVAKVANWQTDGGAPRTPVKAG
jgi:hypothetical protein